MQERDAKHVLYLAQAYREKAIYMHRNKNTFDELTTEELYNEIDLLNEKSSQLYMYVIFRYSFFG